MKAATPLLATAIAVAAAALPLTASAQLRVDYDSIDDTQWRYRLTPYAWGAGLDGTVGKFGRRATIEKSFGEVLEGLDAGAMLGFEARRGRIGLLADFMHVRVSEADRVPTPIGIAVDAHVKARSTTALLAAQYRSAAADWGYVDLIGGARHWSLHTDVRLGAPLDVGGSDTESWTDPVIGVKGLYRLGPRSYAMGWAMVGGFGARSRFSSDLMGALGYTLNDQAALLLGWRRLAVDYRESGFVFDSALQGPALGLDYRF